jgi:uncharacterized membrane protein
METLNRLFDFALKSFRRYFLVGVFTIAPFALTVYIILLIAGWFDSQFQPAIQVISEKYLGRDQPIPGLGIVIGIGLIFLVGMAAPSFLGRQFVSMSEYVVKKIPLAKVIYSAARQVLDAVSKPGEEKFNRVVMVPLFRDEVYALGFVTQESNASWIPDRQDHRLAVFVPTTPNPTSGFLIFTDPKDTLPMAMSVEEGLKVVISGALAKPEYLTKEEARRLAANPPSVKA